MSALRSLRLLAALGGDRPNSLFFAGDLGQRIFQQPFSWKSLGVDIRGRSRTLHINYRTSHQIRMQADRLLGPEVADVDGNTEERRGTVSVFNGPAPAIETFKESGRRNDGGRRLATDSESRRSSAHEIGVFVRSDAELDRARAAVAKTGLAVQDARRSCGDDQRSDFDWHHALGEGLGVSSCGGDGLR